jgi:hypothetical protein
MGTQRIRKLTCEKTFVQEKGGETSGLPLEPIEKVPPDELRALQLA